MSEQAMDLGMKEELKDTNKWNKSEGTSKPKNK